MPMPKIKNRARLRRRMLAMAPAIKAEIRPAMEQGANEVVALQRSLVPKGRTKRLFDSINWVYGDPPRDSKLAITSKGEPDLAINNLKISIFAGSFAAYYARWVEFGTRGRPPGAYRDERGRRRNAGQGGHAATPARPFFFPAWRALRKSVLARITRGTNKALKKASIIS